MNSILEKALETSQSLQSEPLLTSQKSVRSLSPKRSSGLQSQQNISNKKTDTTVFVSETRLDSVRCGESPGRIHSYEDSDDDFSCSSRSIGGYGSTLGSV